METYDLLKVIKMAVEEKASDLHLTVNIPPRFRLDGKLVSTSLPPIKPQEAESIAREIIPLSHYEKFKQYGECDFSYGLHGLGRFRVSVFRQRGTVAIVMRIIQAEIPDLDELGLAPALETFTEKSKGLILVTGPTGSGKSTTLASLLNIINEKRQGHIITLEDPVEFLHSHKNCIVNQREIGQDSTSFERALKVSLRQDPDIILLGEMRDLETIKTVVTAAEMGNLVFATLHTLDAPKTIDRIIDVFPPHQQHQIRVQLASILEGIIAQRLLPKKKGKGRIAASELLIITPEVRQLIREGKTQQIYSVMADGAEYGMQTMDNNLKDLYERGEVALEDVLANAVDSDSLKTLLK